MFLVCRWEAGKALLEMERHGSERRKSRAAGDDATRKRHGAPARSGYQTSSASGRVAGGNHLPLAAASVTIEHYGIHHYIFDFINLTQDFSIVLTFDLYSIVYPNTPYSS